MRLKLSDMSVKLESLLRMPVIKKSGYLLFTYLLFSLCRVYTEFIQSDSWERDFCIKCQVFYF